jgi:hypothetical protein
MLNELENNGSGLIRGKVEMLDGLENNGSGMNQRNQNGNME